MRAYHLSPNLFSEFDLGHVSEGFSTALKGYGLYFTLDKNVVDYYRAQLEDVDGDDFQWYLYTVDIDMVDASNARIVNEWDPEGWELYGSLVEELGSEKEASKAMVEECGVNGIKYYDEEDGNSILVFNPNVVHILKTRPIDAYGKLLIESRRLQEADKSRFIKPIFQNEYIRYQAASDVAYDMGINSDLFVTYNPTENDLIKFVNCGAADKLKINWMLLGKKAEDADQDSPSWKEISRLFQGYIDYMSTGGSAKSRRHSLTQMKKLFENPDNYVDLGENENWLFVGVLTWQAALKCNTADVGNQPSKWCIGYTANDGFWRSHSKESFVLCLKKPNAAEFMTDYDYDRKAGVPARKYMMEIYSNNKVNVWRPCDDPSDTISDWERIEELFGVDAQLTKEWFTDVKSQKANWWDITAVSSYNLPAANTVTKIYEVMPGKSPDFINADITEQGVPAGCTFLYDASYFTTKDLKLYRVVMGPYRPTSENAENCVELYIKNVDNLEIDELITSTKFRLILENVKSLKIRNLYLANENIPDGKLQELIASNSIQGIEIRGNLGSVEILQRAYLLGNKDLSETLDYDLSKTAEGIKVFRVRENLPKEDYPYGISQGVNEAGWDPESVDLGTIVLDFQKYDASEIFRKRLPADENGVIDIAGVVDVPGVETAICRNVPVEYSIRCDTVSNIIIQHQPQR